MSNAPSEIKSLTGVRGAAAIAVMLYHFHQHQHSSGPFWTVGNHGYLAVDLFFVLSGFVMAHVYGEAVRGGTFRWREFLGHRFARIYPLYALATLGCMALATVKSQGAPLSVLLSNLLMVQAIGNWPSIDPPAWSISVEAIVYLLFPVIAFLCLQRGRLLAMAMGAVALGSVLAMTIAADRHLIGAPIAMGELDLFYSPYTVVRCLAGFTLGQLVWRWHETWLAREVANRDLVQVAILAAMLALMTRTTTDFAIYLTIVALILALGTDRGVVARVFSSGPFQLAGQLSLGVYLIHAKAFGILDGIGKLLSRVSHATGATATAASMLCALVVIGASWLLHILIERPARVAIRKWQSRKPIGSRQRPAISAPA